MGKTYRTVEYLSYWVVEVGWWDLVSMTPDGSSTERLEIRYITDKKMKNGALRLGRANHAKLFDTAKEAYACRFLAASQFVNRTVLALAARDDHIKGVLRHRARIEAQKRFSLPYSCPAYVIADRYEEEGEVETATLLRGK